MKFWKENRGLSLEKAQDRFCKINFVEFKTRLIAQWTEHQIPILGVEGSNPSWPTFN